MIETRRSKTKIIVIVAVVIAVIAIGLAIFFFMRYNEVRNNPNAISQETTQRVVEKVEMLYELPDDEEPTIAEVSDREKVREQPFFKSAENGDYILIYPQAKIAILYRESDNKIINVGPIAINEGENQQDNAQDNSEGEAAEQPTPPPAQ